jgi:CRP/FNR family nitrogen fixation transcriptional regulator
VFDAPVAKSDNTFDSALKSTPFEAPSACSGRCRFIEDGSTFAGAETAAAAPYLKLTRHSTIYSRGERALFSYTVMEGAVRLSRLLMDGHRQVLEILLPNDTFGIESSDTYEVTAECISDVILLRCPRACIARLSEEKPEMRRSLTRMLNRGLSAAQDHVMMLGHRGAKARISAFLLRLLETGRARRGGALELPIGRQDLADYLGLTIETTCRTLTDLKHSGVIAIPNRHEIVVRSRSALQAFAEGEAA